MAQFVNTLDYGSISTLVRDPFDVTLESLATSGTELVSALRFAYPPMEGDDGVDISSVVTVAGQVATVADVWADTETDEDKVPGVVRLQVVARNTNDSAQEEVNILINIL